MASHQIIEIKEDDEAQISSSLQGNNKSELKHRRRLRKRSTSTVGSTTITNLTPTSIATTSVTTDNEANSQYFLNPECLTVSRRQRSLSSCCTIPTGHNTTIIHSDNFMSQRVTVTRSARSSSEFLHNEAVKSSTAIVATAKENSCGKLSSSTQQQSVDIDVHVFTGTASVINHINLNKQKLMARKPLTNIRSRKSAITLQKTQSQKDTSKKTEVEEQHNAKLSAKVKTPPVSRKIKRSAKKSNFKDTKEIVQSTSKTDEVPKKHFGGITKRKSFRNHTSRFTQTDNGVMQPCPSFIQNKKCPLQSICPYMHSEFPCKYYYLGLECPQDNNCQFMHNGLLSEQQKNALRGHILKQMSTSSSYPLSESDCNFLDEIRNKKDLWDCLQNVQNKLRNGSLSVNFQTQPPNEIVDDASIIEAKGQLDFITPLQKTASNSPSLAEMQTQVCFFSPQQMDCLKNNYKIRSRDELMQLSLGQLHQMGIIQMNETLVLMRDTFNVDDDEKQQGPEDTCNVDELVAPEIIEVDDNDENDGDHVLMIDETSNEPNGRILPATNEPDGTEHQIVKSPQQPEQTQTFECQDKVEECYWNLREANNVIDTVEESLNKLKHKTIPIKEKASELMAIFETLSRQEKIIERNSISHVQATPEKSAISDDIVSTLPALLCEVDNTIAEENCNFLIEEDEENNNNYTKIASTTDQSNPKQNIENNTISEDILTPNEHLSLNCDNMDSVEASNSVVMIETSAIVDTRRGKNSGEDMECVDGKENETNRDLMVESHEVSEDREIRSPKEDSNNNKDIDEYESNKVGATTTLQLYLSPEKVLFIDDLSAPNIQEDIDDEDSPPYENIVSSVENTPKSVKKSVINASTRKARPRLRSDSLHQNEDISSNSQESDVAPIKTFKPRRLKIPKPRETHMEKSSQDGTSDHPNEEKSLPSLVGSPEQKVILSNRYSKKTKAKHQEKIETNIDKSVAQKTDNYMTDESVESQMSALCGEDEVAIDHFDNNIVKFGESSSLVCSQDSPQAGEIMESAIPRDYLKNNKVVSLKIETNQSKTKCLKSKNITSITKTFRRRVSFETPITTSNTSVSTEEIVSKCHRGKPYVVLTKLKPQFLKSLRKQREVGSRAASHTSVTTTCNITNSTSSTTTTASPGSTCLCDGTSHVLGQKRTCVTNTDEEKDFECDLQAHHKVMRMDSMNILRENKMECEPTQRNTVTQRITYQNNVVFEDISTTDYYSSSDEKASAQNELQSSSSSKQSTHEIQLKNESDLSQDRKSISNKSDLPLLQIQTINRSNANAPTETSEEVDDLQQRILNEQKKILNTSSTDLLDVEPEDGHHSQKNIDENQNEKKAFDLPSTSPKAHRKLSYILLHSADGVVGAQDDTDTSNNKIQLSSAKGVVVVEYSSDVIKNDSNEKSKADNVEYDKYTSLNDKLSTPHMAKRRINFENNFVNVTPIASPTYACDGIASPSPVKGGGGLLVATVEYQLGGEIDGRLRIPPIPYILREIDVSGLDVNKPKNIDKLMKTASLDPRIFRSDIKRVTTVYQQPQQSSTAHYQTFTNPAPTNAGYYPSVSPYDPRNRSHTIVQQSPQPHAQNALVCYNINPSTAVAVPPSSPATGMMQNFMPTQMNVMPAVPPTSSAFAQRAQQQTPNMILYDCIQNSAWYHSLPSSSKMQVNQSATHLVTALNSFQRERCLNPAAVFNIFKLDNAIELLENMNNLGIFVDDNGVINKQTQAPPSYAGRSCAVLGSMPSCNATYSFIQQVLTPPTQCNSLPRAAAGSCNTAQEPFVSCYLDPPKAAATMPSCCAPPKAAATMPCCAHKHQHEDMPQRPEQPSSDDNYNDNRRNNQFRKPFNQNQSQGGSYHNQRFNNNSRYSKPSSSYSYGGESQSPTRSSSPQSQSFFPRGGGGGGRFNNNRRPQNSGDGGSSPPPFKPYNNNRKFNKNNNFNKNSNYGNNTSSPTRATSPLTSSSRFGSYQKQASPPPLQRTPPPLSPRLDKEQSPVLNSPAKQQQQHQASTDEECWD